MEETALFSFLTLGIRNLLSLMTITSDSIHAPRKNAPEPATGLN